jgi:GTP diphosphokinase / guanosine-3',5'-bis(diphosphate) 3'-diphosphatase
MARGNLQREVVELVTDVLGGSLDRSPGKESLPWLMRPGKIECRKQWVLISTIYRALESRTLPGIMPKSERRRVDGIVVLPDGTQRIIEVDEYQHFNAFRGVTLGLYPKRNPAAFPLQAWLKKCRAVRRLPGAGFAKPCPPLFPGDGGRHRQRAFRDALCDLLPPLYGFHPTLRIAHFEVEDWIESQDAKARMRDLLRGRGLVIKGERRRRSTLTASPSHVADPVTESQDSRSAARDPVSRLLHAAAFAADKHRLQKRKDAEASPYINHPIALAELLSSAGSVRDVDVLCAALLHDTIEDTATTFEELERAFDAGIAVIVREVTDNKSLAKEERKRLQVENAARASPSAKLVKLADKICNLRDLDASPPTDWSLERKRKYFDWAKEVVDQLRGVHPRLEQLFDGEYLKRP